MFFETDIPMVSTLATIGSVARSTTVLAHLFLRKNILNNNIRQSYRYVAYDSNRRFPTRGDQGPRQQLNLSSLVQVCRRSDRAFD